VSEATVGTMSQLAPLDTIDASIRRIKWAADNMDSYRKCFLDKTFLSDTEADIVKNDRASTVLNVLGQQMSNIGILPFAHPESGNSTSAASNSAMMVSGDEAFQLSRRNGSIYFGDSQCKFKFQVNSNNDLLAE
jgi:hypothetical protein